MIYKCFCKASLKEIKEVEINILSTFIPIVNRQWTCCMTVCLSKYINLCFHDIFFSFLVSLWSYYRPSYSLPCPIWPRFTTYMIFISWEHDKKHKHKPASSHSGHTQLVTEKFNKGNSLIFGSLLYTGIDHINK